MRFVREAVALALVAAAAFMSVPSSVSANMSTEPTLEDPFTGVLTLILINFSTDLFLVAAAVYGAMSIAKQRVGDIPQDPWAFVGSVVVAAAVVAVAGGFIDFALLYERVEDHYILKDFSVAASDRGGGAHLRLDRGGPAPGRRYSLDRLPRSRGGHRPAEPPRLVRDQHVISLVRDNLYLDGASRHLGLFRGPPPPAAPSSRCGVLRRPRPGLRRMRAVRGHAAL